ncbi:hypothetical protein FB451DRAFT_1167945 [Mycena latifolia]|nr:hypothetical protein FB451DRAFT_1167945 [Mycena latifolia]
MLSCSKLIGFITTALVMGGVRIPLSFFAYPASNRGGTGELHTGAVTEFGSIEPEPAHLGAHFYGSSDCSHVIGDPDDLSDSIEYNKPVSLNFTAYTANNGGGASTQYEAITDKCYSTSATVRSIKPEPVKLQALFYAKPGCILSEGEEYNEPTPVAYNQVANTYTNAHSVTFFEA